MGLNLVVGMLTDEGEEARAYYASEFEALNEILHSNGLSRHVEPIDEMEWNEAFSCDLLSHSGIHYLRRIAAHRALGNPTPGPGDPQTYYDATLFQEYFNRFEAGENLHYQHLIMHSDAGGYYVPIDFERVIVTPTLPSSGGWVGSTQRLQAECVELAAALNMPVTMHHESEELSNAAFSQLHPKSEFLRKLWPWRNAQSVMWKEYAIETYVCLRLLAACKVSLQTKAAIVFC